MHLAVPADALLGDGWGWGVSFLSLACNNYKKIVRLCLLLADG